MKTDLITYLIEHYGKSFTYANLAKEIDSVTSRVAVYLVMDELMKTGHVKHESKDKSDGKKVASWMVDDSDESHAIALTDAYLRPERHEGI